MAKKKRQDSIESLFQDSFNNDTKPKRPKQQSKRFMNLFSFTLILLLMVAVLGLLMVMTVVLYDPGIIGMGWQDDLTATFDSIRLTENALQATAHYNNEQAINIESTRIAVDSWQRQLYHDSTQIALNNKATQTAAAIVNAQQATLAALNYEGTQSAFERVATQVELNYQNTQAVINRDATAMALGFSTETPYANNAIALTATPNSD